MCHSGGIPCRRLRQLFLTVTRFREGIFTKISSPRYVRQIRFKVFSVVNPLNMPCIGTGTATLLRNVVGCFHERRRSARGVFCECLVARAQILWPRSIPNATPGSGTAGKPHPW